jgi:hypothetical protein
LPVLRRDGEHVRRCFVLALAFRYRLISDGSTKAGLGTVGSAPRRKRQCRSSPHSIDALSISQGTMIMTTSAMMPTTHSDPDQLDRLMRPVPAAACTRAQRLRAGRSPPCDP